ncbi:unnamed protein product [Prorocentrum cordatum]|uniref:Uncharacterized protein n=1 Tax=Prorocentrum cordatum TaxID=2364126 RepID=A0ABN9SHD1_9DINO|nr:unnamed protein product [Polarella glacialis]
MGNSIGIRRVPDVKSPKSGMSLLNKEIFAVSEVVDAEGGQQYLRLADGRGWAFTRSSNDGRLLAVPISPEEAAEAAQMQMSGQQRMMMEAGWVAALANASLSSSSSASSFSLSACALFSLLSHCPASRLAHCRATRPPPPYLPPILILGCWHAYLRQPFSSPESCEKTMVGAIVCLWSGP